MRGSILLEGLFALSLVVFSIVLSWEICRRSWFEIALQHSAFLAARDTILGESSRTTYRKVRFFAVEALGVKWGDKLAEPLWREPGDTLAAGVARLHLRFPSLLRFRLGECWKHHFEITHVCRFPFSF